MIALAAALSLASVSRAEASGVEPAKATPVQREQAQSRFVKGRELYNQKKYEAALAEMNASLDIVASPNTRLYVGRCLRDLGRTVAAYVELGRASIEAKEMTRDDPRYEKTGQAANDERAALATKLGFVEVTVAHAAPTTTLKIGGEEVRRAGWTEPFPVAPGTADVVVESPGHGPIRQQVQVAAGEHKAISIDAGASAEGSETAAVAAAPTEPDPDKSSGSALRPLAYVTGGLAVVGLATFVIAGSMSNSTFSKLEDECGSGPCPAGHDDDISAGKTQQTFANIGLAVFVVSGAASVTLFVLSSKRTATPAAAATGSTRKLPSSPVTARVVASPKFVGLQGSF